MAEETTTNTVTFDDIEELLAKSKNYKDRVEIVSVIDNRSLFELPDFMKSGIIADEMLTYENTAKNARKYAKSVSGENESVIQKTVNAARQNAEKLQTELEVLRDKLGTSFNNLITFRDLSDEVLDEFIRTLISNLETAIQPFLDLPGMPEIPLIGSLKDILETLIELGKVKREISAAAPKEFYERKKKELNDQQNGDWLTRLKNSAIGQLLISIGELIMVLCQNLYLFVQFFIVNLLLELIELLKPVFDAFGIIAGTFIGLLTKLPELLKAMTSISGFFLFILKSIWNKIEMVWDLLYVLNPFDAESQMNQQEKMEALWKTIAQNELKMELCEKTIMEIPKRKNLEGIQKTFEKSMKKHAKNSEKYPFDENKFKEANLPIVEDYSKLLDDIAEKFDKQVFDMNVLDRMETLKSEQAKS